MRFGRSTAKAVGFVPRGRLISPSWLSPLMSVTMADTSKWKNLATRINSSASLLSALVNLGSNGISTSKVPSSRVTASPVITFRSAEREPHHHS